MSASGSFSYSPSGADIVSPFIQWIQITKSTTKYYENIIIYTSHNFYLSNWSFFYSPPPPINLAISQYGPTNRRAALRRAEKNQ